MSELKHCEFVELTSLIPEEWGEWFYSEIADSSPFAWGTNAITLVTASEFKDFCGRRLTAVECEEDPAVVRAFLEKLEALGETYIDLEH